MKNALLSKRKVPDCQRKNVPHKYKSDSLSHRTDFFPEEKKLFVEERAQVSHRTPTITGFCNLCLYGVIDSIHVFLFWKIDSIYIFFS